MAWSCIQGEIGWPSATDDAALGINPEGSPAGIPELQTLLECVSMLARKQAASLTGSYSTWVCQSNTNKTRYFWFSAIDEPWKSS